MTLRERLGHEQQAMAIGRLLRNAAADLAPPQWQRLGFERLVRSVNGLHKSAVGHARLHTYGLIAAAFAVIAGGAWLSFAHSAISTVAFRVNGADLSNSNYVVAPVDASAKMDFTDGSSVELSQSTRLRVQQLTAQGVTLVLERGRAVSNVVHHSGSQWKMLAGPFEISVVGTRFQTDWDPMTEALTVDLYQGSLKIDGQRSGESAVLQKGQRFRAVGRRTSWSISPIDEANDPARGLVAVPEASGPSPGTFGPAAPSAMTTMTSRNALTPIAHPTASNWASAMAKGEFSRVVAEAEARGFAMCLDQCSIGDVRILADAARYTRRFELAEQALNALRRRATGEAPAAAYLLGALNESQGRSMAALRWYEQCVTEAPTGRFVSEAQAGRLRMFVATNQHESAVTAARQYLSEYRHGVGEATARKVLDQR